MKKKFWGIGGNQQRIFISSSFGCQYNCRYCYLSEMNIRGRQEIYSYSQILDELSNRKIFVEGKDGSIITIGCYSECMDEVNKKTTIKLICYFLDHYNYVQLSTKKELTTQDFLEISKHIKFENQMLIFISLPTMEHADYFEPDVDCPKQRIHNIPIAKKYGVNVYLYIKPFIETITIQDLDKYIELINKYDIQVVVGYRMHVWQGESPKVLISHTEMIEDKAKDYEEFVNIVSKITKVYKHSDDVIRQIRKMRREK